VNFFYILPFALAGFSTLFIGALAWPHRRMPKAWITRKRIAALSIIPFITLILVWTDSRHHLIWKKFWVVEDRSFPMMGLQHGPSKISIRYSNLFTPKKSWAAAEPVLA
jgi:hypothetical protein